MPCETPQGCEIEDIAPYQWAEDLVLGFYEARVMFEMSKSAIIYERQLQELGLLEDLEMLQALELAFIDVKKYHHDKELLRQKTKK